MRLTTKDIAIVSLFTVLISISAQIRISLLYVPITLQLFTISLGAFILSTKQIQYSLIGFICLSFFGIITTGSNVSGPQIFLSPTFGFIIGFFPMTYFMSKTNIYDKQNDQSRVKSVLNILIGYASLYIIGLLILNLNLNFIYNIHLSLSELITLYFVPFIVTDILSILSALFISNKVKLKR